MAGQRCIVGVADKPDRHALPVPHIVQCLSYLSGKVVGNCNRFVLIPQRRDKVLDAHPRRFAFLVPHLADVFHPAHLDALDVFGLIRCVRPFAEFLVAGEMPLDRLAWPGRTDLTGARGGGQQQKSGKHK